MPQLLNGIAAYINSFRGPLAIVALMIAAYMWMRGHHFAAAIEVLAALAILFSAQQLVGQFGLG